MVGLNCVVRHQEAGEDVWQIANHFERGKRIDVLRENNLGFNYPTYDHFNLNGNIATSVKSLNPMCKSYIRGSSLMGRLNRYVRSLLNGKNNVLYKGMERQIKEKCLEIVLPDVPLTDAQLIAIREFIETNSDKCKIVITILS